MSSNAYPERPLAVIDWQVREHSEQLKSLRHWRGNTDMKLISVEDKIDRIAEEVRELGETVGSLRKTLMAFSFTVAGSSMVFALSVLAATGKF